MAGSLPARTRALIPDLLDWWAAGLPSTRGGSGVQAIPNEVIEEEGAYLVRAELPGLDPEQDIEVTADADILTIRAHHAETKQDGRHSEFRYGSIQRSVRLPYGSPESGVDAEYASGILTLTVPKPQRAKQATRTIKVRRTG